MINLETASYDELLIEYEEMMTLASNYYYDCVHFYINAIRKRIVELGGWPVK